MLILSSFLKITLFADLYSLLMFEPAFCFFKVRHGQNLHFRKKSIFWAVHHRKLLDCIAHPKICYQEITRFLLYSIGSNYIIEVSTVHTSEVSTIQHSRGFHYCSRGFHFTLEVSTTHDYKRFPINNRGFH